MSSTDDAPVRKASVGREEALEHEDARWNMEGLRALLDVAFGYFLWVGHFLLLYIATAVSCQLGIGAAGASSRTTFLILLALATVIIAAVVVLHALRRYRQQRDVPRLRFRMTITMGNSAVATVAIVWQLFAITLVPLCA
jgi:hypothetical protein